MAPQFFPSRAQSAWSDSGIQPQTFGAPPPPQPWGNGHDPQVAVREPPQLSMAVNDPQVLPCRAHKAASVSGMHPHVFGLPPPPQVLGEAQLPQKAVRPRPQLSGAFNDPQVAPWRLQKVSSLSGAHPQTFGVPPPPQVSGAPQLPQSSPRKRPHLSSPVTVPQDAFWRLQKSGFASGVQPHILGVPPPPQVSVPEQKPQLIFPPQPSSKEPQFCAKHSRRTQGAPTLGLAADAASPTSPLTNGAPAVPGFEDRQPDSTTNMHVITTAQAAGCGS